MVSWDDEGKGPIPISLADAQWLAIEGGFVFPGAEDPALPLTRRANLPGMFLHHEVNSLSAFRERFWAGLGRGAPPASSSSSQQPGWRLSPGPAPGEHHAGATHVNGQRHGPGALLVQGSRSCVLYVGHFSEGARSGFGTVQTSRGEGFAGYFRDDLMWGPGRYSFPHKGGGGGGGGAHRQTYTGMFNGRPSGLGLLTWSDGRQQAGRFEGEDCCEPLLAEGGEVQGVLTVAASNAAQAEASAAEVWRELAAQQQLLEAVLQLCQAAGLDPPAAAAAGST